MPNKWIVLSLVSVIGVVIVGAEVLGFCTPTSYSPYSPTHEEEPTPTTPRPTATTPAPTATATTPAQTPTWEPPSRLDDLLEEAKTRAKAGDKVLSDKFAPLIEDIKEAYAQAKCNQAIEALKEAVEGGNDKQIEHAILKAEKDCV